MNCFNYTVVFTFAMTWSVFKYRSRRHESLGLHTNADA